MSIYQTAADDLALLLTATTGVSILSTHFTVVAIAPTLNGESVYNTKIRIKFVSPSTLTGEKTFYYDRLNLADLEHLHPFTDGRLRSAGGIGTSLYNLFPALRNGLGIQFTQADVVETFGEDDGIGIKIQLLAKPSSVGWFGTYSVKMAGYPNISEAFHSQHVLGF